MSAAPNTDGATNTLRDHAGYFRLRLAAVAPAACR